MKVNELINLWVGYNEVEDFRILICALDEVEAQEIVDGYCLDSHMEGKFEITEFYDINTRFDCDYMISGGF